MGEPVANKAEVIPETVEELPVNVVEDASSEVPATDDEDAPVKFTAPEVTGMEPSFSPEFALKVTDSNSVGDVWWVDSGAT